MRLLTVTLLVLVGSACFGSHGTDRPGGDGDGDGQSGDDLAPGGGPGDGDGDGDGDGGGAGDGDRAGNGGPPARLEFPLAEFTRITRLDGGESPFREAGCSDLQDWYEDGCGGSGWMLPGTDYRVFVDTCLNDDRFTIEVTEEYRADPAIDLVSEEWSADLALSGEVLVVEFMTTPGSVWRFAYWVEGGLGCNAPLP